MLRKQFLNSGRLSSSAGQSTDRLSYSNDDLVRIFYYFFYALFIWKLHNPSFLRLIDWVAGNHNPYFNTLTYVDCLFLARDK